MKNKNASPKPSPKAPKESGFMLSIRLPRPLVDELDALVERSGASRSSYVQIAVAEYLDRRKKERVTD
jgi:metal-responsive CopG/Arc/MetJ family transcriptional regulator